MRGGGGQVDVSPRTVLPVFAALRENARACTSAALMLTTRTPPMPPRFLLAVWRPAIEAAATELFRLAAETEIAAVQHWWRLTRIEEAAGENLEVPLGAFAGDLGWAGRLAWERITTERGFDVLADPPGQRVHAAMGAVDNVLSMWHTTAVLLQGTPLYGKSRPGGLAARQALVSMGINLTRMSPMWAVLEPADAMDAAVDTVGRVIDVQDLRSGDVFRWGGHVGTGMLLGKGADALVAGETAGTLEVVPTAGAGLRTAARDSYRGINEANKVPPSRSAGPRTSTGRRIRQVEDDFGNFLETALP